MKAVILAAGYATRLYPLTLDRPKALLPVARAAHGRAPARQLAGRRGARRDLPGHELEVRRRLSRLGAGWDGSEVQIVDDGTGDEETKLGAIGDLELTIREAAIDDDLLVLAGRQPLQREPGAVRRVRAAEGRAGDRRLRRRRPRGDPPLQRDRARRGRPADVLRGEARAAASTLTGIALYFYPRESLGLVREYLEAGNNPDQPGRLVAVALPARRRSTPGACPAAGTTSARRRRCAEADRGLLDRRDNPARIRHEVVTHA